jgi:hypothetical protein
MVNQMTRSANTYVRQSASLTAALQAHVYLAGITTGTALAGQDYKPAAAVLDVLGALGVDAASATARRQLAERGQLRCRWEHVPIDLFFAYDALHARCRERALRVPFGAGASIPILSAEDLAIFKGLFDREKDWRDLRELLFALGGEFDAPYALDWLRRILAAGDERLARFEALLHGGDEPVSA